MLDRINSPFFFAENTVTGAAYYDMPHECLLPQVLELQSNIMLQHDGSLRHWSLDGRNLLNRHFPGRWIGRDEPIAWPSRSLISPPCIFFFRDTSSIVCLRNPCSRSCRTLYKDCCGSQKRWCFYDAACMDELEYRLDILRASRGAHVEVLKLTIKIWQT